MPCVSLFSVISSISTYSIYHISKNASNDYLGLRYVDPRWVTLEGFTNATSEAPAPVPPVEVGSPLFTKVSYIPGGCLGISSINCSFQTGGCSVHG